MNERVCSSLNPEVFPKYRRSLATASTQTEIASASSGVLERVVIIVVAENAPAANDRDEARRAEGVQHAAEAPSRRRLQHACSTFSLPFAAWHWRAPRQRGHAV